MDMFFLKRPSLQAIERSLQIAEQDTFSYKEVGHTVRGSLPPGYNVDHNRVLLGYGAAVFERAKAALGAWRMFELEWVELLHRDALITPGQTVLILAQTCGIYSLSASRILECIDQAVEHETNVIHRFGFSYGTLTHHVEKGEERFTVEHHTNDDSVWYDLLAFSVPQHPLARIGYLASRAAQRRFARDSKAAMVRATT
jgi:uncharacterized protein (UPF0548 family)